MTTRSPAVLRGIKPRRIRGLFQRAAAWLTGSRLGIDYAWHGTINPAALRAAGVEFVCRYLSHSPAKNLTRAEAELLSRHGIDLAVVWETRAGRALEGYAAGQADASYALQQAIACGMPSTRPIYFAVDFDATDAQKPLIRRYFQGVVNMLGVERTGAYGGYWVIKNLLDNGLIKYGWQTYAWSGGRWDSRAQLRQFRNGVRVGGIDSDWDRAMSPDFGQWRIGAAAPSRLAARYNAPGELHNDRYPAPKADTTPLYYPNGVPTGAALERSRLTWGDGHDGKVQLDFKERTEHAGRHYVFARGGRAGDNIVEYGHVWVGDLEGPLGDPVPSGDGRGDPAARTDRLVTVTVNAIPDDFYYKPGAENPGSKFANYGDSGAKFDRPGAYAYMCWSTVRTDAATGLGEVNHGGGIVRCLVPNGGHVWLCDVGRVHCAALDRDGNRIGTVTWAYVERTGLFGWMVVAHQRADGELVHHIV